MGKPMAPDSLPLAAICIGGGEGLAVALESSET